MPKRTSDYHVGLLGELRDPRMAAHYLNAALEDSDEMFLKALRNVAEARQMAKVAKGAGVSRESIYRMLSGTGNPTYSSLLGILSALGLSLSVQIKPSHRPARFKQLGQPTRTRKRKNKSSSN